MQSFSTGIHYNHFQHIAYYLDRFIFSKLYALVECLQRNITEFIDNLSIFIWWFEIIRKKRDEASKFEQKLKENIEPYSPREHWTSVNRTVIWEEKQTIRKMFGKLCDGIYPIKYLLKSQSRTIVMEKLTAWKMWEIEQNWFYPATTDSSYLTHFNRWMYDLWTFHKNNVIDLPSWCVCFCAHYKRLFSQ